jgi:integrase
VNDTAIAIPPTRKPKPKAERGIGRRGKSFQVYLTHEDGRVERRSMKNVTLKMAIKQRVVWQREIEEGKYIKKVPRAARILFSAIADKAVEHAKNYKRVWDADEGRLKLMKEWWSGKYADEISTPEIDAKLLETMRARKWTETTSNEYRVVLVHAFKLAIDRGEVTVNPAQKAHRYKLHNERKRELSADEETRLRAAIVENYPHKIHELDLALHCGARRSNLYGISTKGRKPMPPLDWKDVDLNFKVIQFPRAKGGDGYTVPLNSVALAALKKLRERSPDGCGPVVRKPSGLTLQSCRKWFENCLAKAGIEDFRYHDLRHTFGTRLRRNGVPLEDIALLLDHDVPELRMTLRYAHADLDRLFKAVATLETSTKTDTLPVVVFPQAARA